MKDRLYPWQTTQWQQLQHAKADKRLPHALLLSGIAGIGKRAFADAFVCSLLCDQADVSAAGKVCDCHACHLIAGRSHPDVLWIEPEKAGQAIKVDQVREINHFMQQSSMGDACRVVVIAPADAMNTNAANALLKTLEEPSQQAYLLLVCDQAGSLPATILSRCQQIHFPRPEKSLAMLWLQQQLKNENVDIDLCLRLAYGAPCKAYSMIREEDMDFRAQVAAQLTDAGNGAMDPLRVAAGIKDVNYVRFVDIMLSWLLDLVKLQLGADSDDIVNIDQLAGLQALTLKTQIKANLQLADKLRQLTQAIHSGVNLNKQMMLESALIAWVNGINRSAAA